MLIRALLLDAGGTIVFPNYRRIADELARDSVRVDPAALARADAAVRLEIDTPDLVSRMAHSTDEERWFRYVENLGAHCGIESFPMAALRRLKAYHDLHNLWEDVPSDVPGILDRLARRYRLGVVSNANGTVRAKLARLGLTARLELVVDSHEEGIEKPDPRLFELALSRMGIAAETTAYVGDMYHIDVVGARAAGLLPLLLDPHCLHADKPCTRVASLAEIADGPVLTR
ncbi:MAG: HAD family hydrolase [Planctomycetes bacterium]|nr:HAD family hydrolase [Planctomycetota bacterium]